MRREEDGNYWCQAGTLVDSVVSLFVIFITLSTGIGSTTVATGMTYRVKQTNKKKVTMIYFLFLRQRSWTTR